MLGHTVSRLGKKLRPDAENGEVGFTVQDHVEDEGRLLRAHRVVHGGEIAPRASSTANTADATDAANATT
jgi:hypothetical protein